MSVNSMSVSTSSSNTSTELVGGHLSARPYIEISGGYLRYQDSQQATISGLNMQIPIGEWTCLLGRSGCGKTTLLRYLAGLLDQKAEWAGQLTFRKSDELETAALTIRSNILNGTTIHENIAYMAQQDLLMPWLTVLDNVLLSTRFDKASECQRQRALNLLEQVGLAEHHQALPQQLSGGMRQRVALARTLMQDKPIVLMDEPFSALDAVTRHRLQNLSHQLLTDKTVVLITHDPQEAVRLASQLYIMQGMPAHAESLTVPQSSVPRKLDADCAALQQSIIEQLEKDYE